MLRSFHTTQTSAAFDFLFFVLVAFPDILKKAQEEIDRVVGSERLPDFTDEHKLPYISAIVKEILRWGAFVPTGIPHTNAADDVYKGYFIPKGSFIVPNAWYALLSSTFYFVLISVLSTGQCCTMRISIRILTILGLKDSSRLTVDSTTPCRIRMRYLVFLGDYALCASLVSVYFAVQYLSHQ